MGGRAESGRRGDATVASCLTTAALSDSVVAVAGDLERRVGWPAVIEWPVGEFVDEGDLVLTTGVGLDGAALAEVVRQVAAAGAAALCLAVGGYHRSFPAPALSAARQEGFTLIEVPWRDSTATPSIEEKDYIGNA